MNTTTATILHDSVFQTYQSLFDHTPLVVRSPGRINLIGEHTDYNRGLVLPAAIDRNIVVAMGEREDGAIHLHALDQGQTFCSSLDTLTPSEWLWPNYVLGVVQQLVEAAYPIKGFNLVFAGDIPQGAGLSSSAALECAVAFAFNELFALGISRLTLALIAQAAENKFVGVSCGLMDQFASLFGKEQQLIKLDCADFSYEYIPFLNPDLQIVLFDTQVKHSLASSAYNERRQQCEYGVSLIQKQHPEVTSLREVTYAQLERFVKPVDRVVYNRCRYVVSEIQRVNDGCKDLKRTDFDTFGKRMFETHDGLQHLYEVSCDELDLLVDLVRDNDAVCGARMMGGGFGGCTINLIQTSCVQHVINTVTEDYRKKTHKQVVAYFFNLSAGTGIVYR